MRPLRPIYRSDETKQSGEGQRYLATARVCPQHDRSPPAISSGHRTSRARPSGDSVTIRSSRPQIQSANSNAGRGTAAAYDVWHRLLFALLGLLARSDKRSRGLVSPNGALGGAQAARVVQRAEAKLGAIEKAAVRRAETRASQPSRRHGSAPGAGRGTAHSHRFCLTAGIRPDRLFGNDKQLGERPECGL
jgi:hypothetical protein